MAVLGRMLHCRLVCRFTSLCQLAGWMEEEGLERRVLEIQKGGCEDVSE